MGKAILYRKHTSLERLAVGFTMADYLGMVLLVGTVVLPVLSTIVFLLIFNKIQKERKKLLYIINK
jgi:hypothetical protein